MIKEEETKIFLILFFYMVDFENQKIRTAQIKWFVCGWLRISIEKYSCIKENLRSLEL